ncbi:hypothetical protein GCM10022631_01930 [Deinococcus rubellus]|uniref:Uncharacterized protein n=1 Tax=Deinococcus rubellus TaxID=1889240 RepID=A0ABY5YI25_9DEIO|nr:hypothetical protein [Deinococcus rubellus]UWX64775.1 hypothetical protein N0D28_03690 [Deinococcus rubellus]
MSRRAVNARRALIAHHTARPVPPEELPTMPDPSASRRAPTERSQNHKHDPLRRESSIAEVSFVSLRLLEALTRREGVDAWTMTNVDRSLEVAVRILRGQ